jgi:hypothetical protein
VTETARAETFGSFIAMLQSGVKQKIWVVTAGACQFCLTNAEEGDVPIMDPFPTGVLAPPQHPRCRCNITASLGDGTFDPNEWAYTPNSAQLDSIMSNPSWGLWPKWVADLELPENKLVTPQEAKLVNADVLPDALLQILNPDVINDIGKMVGDSIADIGFMKQFAAMTEEQAQLPSEAVTQADIEKMLAQASELPEADQQVRDAAWSKIDSIMNDLLNSGESESE